jgi:hypothetical protein
MYFLETGLGEVFKPRAPKNRRRGGILYVEDGALKYRGANGTVTVIAPA